MPTWEVLVKVKTLADVDGKSPEEVLRIIKQTIGLYSDYDVSKLVEVVSVKREP